MSPGDGSLGCAARESLTSFVLQSEFGMNFLIPAWILFRCWFNRPDGLHDSLPAVASLMLKVAIDSNDRGKSDSLADSKSKSGSSLTLLPG